MKKVMLLVPFLIFAIATMACPACEKQQPKFLKGVAHGAGPSSNWDYVYVGLVALAALATLIFTIKWIARPGEKNNDHIKRTVLNFQ